MTDTHQPIVAIDGPAGSGKSTVAKIVAREAGLQFISSGTMYRAVALQALREGVTAADRQRLIQLAAELPIRFTTDGEGQVHTWLGDEDVTEAIKRPEVAQVASAIATIPELRAHLVDKQREYGKAGGIVMEGRDIQTVVFPDAEVKVFLTASAEERATRRWKELAACGDASAYQTVLDEVRTRDRRDAERDASPLCAAPNAIMIDTDRMTIDQVVECLLRIIAAWRAHPALSGADLAQAAGCGKPARGDARGGGRMT
ncbi:MAG: (d)CMP kinase [Armatimonadota bacterium]